MPPVADPVVDATALPVLLPRIEHAGRFAAARDVPFHAHPGAELVLVTEGACQSETCIGGTRFPGRQGTLFVQPANVPHDQRNLKFTRTTYVVFFALPAQFDATARIIQIPDRDPIGAWMEQICDFSATGDSADGRVASALLFACLERLHSLEHRRQTSDAFPPALARAVAKLEANLTTPFQAGELARHAGLSMSHMNTLFRRHLGRSPLRYQQDRRLGRARMLLLGPYARVNEVAAACGYDDANYFVRLFTRQFGVSPGEWRKRQEGRGGLILPAATSLQNARGDI